MSQIRRYRTLRKLSQQKLAELVGTSQPQIKRLESGDRQLTVNWAERLAPHLGVDPQELLFADSPIMARVVMAPVLGVIQAGHWVEATAEESPGRMPIVDTGGYAEKDLYVLQVRGDSMDLFVRDGGYVVCVSVFALSQPFRTGMVVHVERRRFDGQMVETTLKEIQMVGSKMTLTPRSSNASHKPIAMDGGEDGEEIEIRGLVLGRYDPAPIC